MTSELKRAAEAVVKDGEPIFGRNKSITGRLSVSGKNIAALSEALLAELQREEPNVEVPFKLPISLDGECNIADAEGHIIIGKLGIRVSWATILCDLANQATSQDAGRELAKKWLEYEKYPHLELWPEMNKLAREVLGQKGE